MVSLFRRFAALFYDTLISIALLLAVTALWVALFGTPQSWYGLFGLRLTLFVLLFGFFGYCWVSIGQTIGMRAWHLWFEAPMTWDLAKKRFMWATLCWLSLGIGYCFQWIEKYSKTHLLYSPQQPSP